ncbi:MAG: hypothetical protein V2A34_15765 [Lentisphaerota bacterium]
MLRRKKNQKKDGRGFRFPAHWAAVLMMAGVMALTYLWLCGRCDALGARIKALEGQKSDVHKKVMNEEFKWCNAKSPRNVEKMLKQFKLDMQFPEEQQIVRLRYKSPEPETRETAFRQEGGKQGLVLHD